MESSGHCSSQEMFQSPEGFDQSAPFESEFHSATAQQRRKQVFHEGLLEDLFTDSESDSEGSFCSSTTQVFEDYSNTRAYSHSHDVEAPVDSVLKDFNRRPSAFFPSKRSAPGHNNQDTARIGGSQASPSQHPRGYPAFSEAAAQYHSHQNSIGTPLGCLFDDIKLTVPHTDESKSSTTERENRTPTDANSPTYLYSERAAASLKKAAEHNELYLELVMLRANNRHLEEELKRIHKREQMVKKEASRYRTEVQELAAELKQSQQICKEMLSARRSAREALSDMAQQNARLVSAYVEKKQDLRRMQDNQKDLEDRFQAKIAHLEDQATNMAAANNQLLAKLSQLEPQLDSLTDEPCSLTVATPSCNDNTGYELQQSEDACVPCSRPENLKLEALEAENSQLQQEVERLRHAKQEAEDRHKKLEVRQQAEQHKLAGNTAYHKEQYEVAVMEYTAALNLGLDDPSYCAVLHCNRAAAQHSQGKYIDAIADCSMAEAYDGEYARLYFRRADAYAAISAYDLAIQDMQLIRDKTGGQEAETKLADLHRKHRLMAEVDHYAVLGVQPNGSLAQIKGAYKKLAIKYHPDKSSGMKRDVGESLFKVISQAHATLSDMEKRQEYDARQLKHKYRSLYAAYKY